MAYLSRHHYKDIEEAKELICELCNVLYHQVRWACRPARC